MQKTKGLAGDHSQMEEKERKFWSYKDMTHLLSDKLYSNQEHFCLSQQFYVSSCFPNLNSNTNFRQYIMESEVKIVFLPNLNFQKRIIKLDTASHILASACKAIAVCRI